MEVVKKQGDNIIVKKRSGRYGVMNKSKNWINGEEKAKILADLGLVTTSKKSAAKPAEEAAVEEPAAEDNSKE